MRTLLVLMFCGALLIAEEVGLLARLQEETRVIAAAADEALVVVNDWRLGHWTSFGDSDSDGDLDIHFTKAWVSAGANTQTWSRTTGVLVGSPPKVVVSYLPVAKRESINVRFRDGKTAKLKRIDGDPELGIAVYALPEAAARGRKGLRIERDWKALRRGSLAVVAGGRLGLAMVSGSDPARGLLHGPHGSGGAALLGTGGSILGLRQPGGAVWSRSCAQCHAGVRNPLLLTFGKTYYGLGVHRGATATPHPVVKGSTYLPGPVIARVVEDIEKHGRIRYGYLGVVLGDVRGKNEQRGVSIASVMGGSPAGKAGLEAGGTILSMDGVRCRAAGTLSRLLVHKRPGDTIALRLAGSDVDVRITLGDRAEAQKNLITPASIGLSCVEPSADLRNFLGLAADARGVVVQEVRAGSAAHKGRLRRGDLVNWAGGSAVAIIEELRAAVASARGSIKLAGIRDGKPFSVTVLLKKPSGKRAR